MKRDEIWKKLKEDKNMVYNEPIFHVFLKTTTSLEQKHYYELSEDLKKLVSPMIKLQVARSLKDLEKAMKEGAVDIPGNILRNAASNGSLEIVEKYADDFKYNYGELSGALYHAIVQGHIKVAKYLLEKVMKLNSNYIPPRYVADIASRHDIETNLLFFDIVKLIIEQCNDSEMPFLISSVQKNYVRLGHLDLVKKLESIASASRHIDYNRMLKDASTYGHFPLIKHAVDHGADNYSYAVDVALNQDVVDYLNLLFDE